MNYNKISSLEKFDVILNEFKKGGTRPDGN